VTTARSELQRAQRQQQTGHGFRAGHTCGARGLDGAFRAGDSRGVVDVLGVDEKQCEVYRVARIRQPFHAFGGLGASLRIELQCAVGLRAHGVQPCDVTSRRVRRDGLAQQRLRLHQGFIRVSDGAHLQCAHRRVGTLDAGRIRHSGRGPQHKREEQTRWRTCSEQAKHGWRIRSGDGRQALPVHQMVSRNAEHIGALQYVRNLQTASHAQGAATREAPIAHRSSRAAGWLAARYLKIGFDSRNLIASARG
jgi:hypothetical protein